MARTAKDILSKYWNTAQLPVEPALIATRMGIVVTADPALDGSGHYEPSGSRNGGPLITYNPTEHLVRQRFTIAHELGHHILEHGPRDRDTPNNFTMGVRDPKEIAANKFAAELLMPTDIVHTLIQVSRVCDIKKLATVFNVSSAAMMYRLKELGYGLE